MITDSEQLWQVWIPRAFTSVADAVADTVDGIAAFVDYWLRLFESLGLRKAAKQLKKPRSPTKFPRLRV